MVKLFVILFGLFAEKHEDKFVMYLYQLFCFYFYLLTLYFIVLRNKSNVLTLKDVCDIMLGENELLSNAEGRIPYFGKTPFIYFIMRREINYTH